MYEFDGKYALVYAHSLDGVSARLLERNLRMQVAGVNVVIAGTFDEFQRRAINPASLSSSWNAFVIDAFSDLGVMQRVFEQGLSRFIASARINGSPLIFVRGTIGEQPTEFSDGVNLSHGLFTEEDAMLLVNEIRRSAAAAKVS